MFSIEIINNEFQHYRHLVFIKQKNTCYLLPTAPSLDIFQDFGLMVSDKIKLLESLNNLTNYTNHSPYAHFSLLEHSFEVSGIIALSHLSVMCDAPLRSQNIERWIKPTPQTEEHYHK